jgi:hypothetical protein
MVPLIFISTSTGFVSSCRELIAIAVDRNSPVSLESHNGRILDKNFVVQTALLLLFLFLLLRFILVRLVIPHLHRPPLAP